MEMIHRAVLTGSAAAVATAVLPASLTMPGPTEQWVRAMLATNIEKAAADLAAAVERGEREELVTWWYGYSLHLNREELRLFERGEGVWRDICCLPMVPEAFTGSADELGNYRALECPPCPAAA